MTRQYQPLRTIMDAQAATGIGLANGSNGNGGLLMEDFKIAGIQFGSKNSGSFTVKFQISYSDDCPDFSAAESVSNHWDYVQVIDLQNGASINGDTGIALTGTDDFRNLELNINGARWFNAVITAYSAGNATVKVKLYDNL